MNIDFDRSLIARPETSPVGKSIVFVSGCHSDGADLSKQIVSDILEAADAAVWRDSEAPLPGNEYSYVSPYIVQNSKALVLVITSDALESEQMWDREYAAAKAANIPVLPVVAGADAAKVEEKLGGAEYVLFDADDRREKLSALLGSADKTDSADTPADSAENAETSEAPGKASEAADAPAEMKSGKKKSLAWLFILLALLAALVGAGAAVQYLGIFDFVGFAASFISSLF